MKGVRKRLVNRQSASRCKVIEFKRRLGREGNLSPSVIEEDIKANLSSSPEKWSYGGLAESDFLALVFEVAINSPNPPEATCGGKKRLLKDVAINYSRGKREGIDRRKIDTFCRLIIEKKPICGFRPIPPLQVNGWINEQAPQDVRKKGSFGISDGIHRSLAYALLLVERKVKYEVVFAYVRPKEC
ncbi:MAG: hypothetical protein QMD08_07540 [Actinomycetota bacterium]|nr:hypothetical protein [Actinomycetota bacterium]